MTSKNDTANKQQRILEMKLALNLSYKDISKAENLPVERVAYVIHQTLVSAHKKQSASNNIVEVPFRKNHHTLTAYALGELSAKDAFRMKRYLKKRPAYRAEVAAIKAIARKLTEQMEDEGTTVVTYNEAVRLQKKTWYPAFWLAFFGSVALASCMVLNESPEKDSLVDINPREEVSQADAEAPSYDPGYATERQQYLKEESKAEPRRDARPDFQKTGPIAAQKRPPKNPQKAAVPRSAPINTRSVAGPKSNKASGVNLSKLGIGTGKTLDKSGPGSIRANFKNAAGGAGGGSGSRSRTYGLGGAGKGKSLGLSGSSGAVNNYGSGSGGLGSGRRVGNNKKGGALVGREKQKRRHAPLPAPAPKDRDESADDAGYTAGTEGYDHIDDNPFKLVSADPLSTFSADVDTASYTNLRRFIDKGQKPPKDAVRIEEMVNYFNYGYKEPKKGEPFSVNYESASAPWKPDHKIVRVGLKTKAYDWKTRPAMNLVFLLDVSGSMQAPNKLPLLQRTFDLLIDSLSVNDTVSIVVYAGASGVVLPATKGSDKGAIRQAITRLRAGGSTNAGAGIEKAYDLAAKNFKKGGVNRVIIATDGDFNVGTTSRGDLTRMIKQKAQTGVFLSVLGFGMGNYKDGTLETLADKGNGNYAYVDTYEEAKKVFKHQLGANLITVAKDVKFQLEFNPKVVQAYRLLGYENRILAHQDFNNDKKDAGEIGAGHQVTVMYEIVPHGVKIDVPGVDPLKYQSKSTMSKVKDFFSASEETLNLKVRYKKPNEDKSKLLQYPYTARGGKFSNSSSDFRFQASVAAFGMILRDSPYMGKTSYKAIAETAEQSISNDPHGYKKQFVGLVRSAEKAPAYKPRQVPGIKPGIYVWRDTGPRILPVGLNGFR